DLGTSFSKPLGIDFDLGIDLGDLGGAADLTASGAINLKFALGFRVDDPTQVYVFKGTGLDGTLNITGDNLTFRAAVGPLGVFVTGGTADISGTVAPGNKLFTAGFKDSAFGTSDHALLFGDGGIDLGTDFFAQV